MRLYKVLLGLSITAMIPLSIWLSLTASQLEAFLDFAPKFFKMVGSSAPMKLSFLPVIFLVGTYAPAIIHVFVAAAGGLASIRFFNFYFFCFAEVPGYLPVCPQGPWNCTPLGDVWSTLPMSYIFTTDVSAIFVLSFLFIILEGRRYHMSLLEMCAWLLCAGFACDAALALFTWRVSALEKKQIEQGRVTVQPSMSYAPIYYCASCAMLIHWVTKVPCQLIFYLKETGLYIYGPPGEKKLDFLGLMLETEAGIRLVVPVMAGFFLVGWCMPQIRPPIGSGALLGAMHAWICRFFLYIAFNVNVAVGFTVFLMYRELQPFHSFELSRNRVSKSD
eukprot:gb/GEZN01009660.1/.p1 GENE.gb/GEZN01009660.1/~~gb/GEZN01009660.1/.p1  ORF type:complete len:333 (+),score=31.78 gb/GEZN01009660.1/:135-1133(+)